MKEDAARPSDLVWAGAIWGSTFAYALTRYVFLGPVPADGIPLFVFNKSISFTAIFLFGLTYWMPRGHARARTFGVVGTWLALTHVLLSMLLFSLEFFESFSSASGRIMIRVQVALLFGLAAALLLLWQHVNPDRATVSLARRVVLCAIVIHVSLIGLPGWLTPDRWYGGLPPITLLCALLGAGGVAASFFRRRLPLERPRD